MIAVLRDEALEVEQYSIDEAFIRPPKVELLEYGKRLRAKVLKWTGIPCGVGFAPTKTLAKIASAICLTRILKHLNTVLLGNSAYLGHIAGEALNMHGDHRLCVLCDLCG